MFPTVVVEGREGGKEMREFETLLLNNITQKLCSTYEIKHIEVMVCARLAILKVIYYLICS